MKRLLSVLITVLLACMAAAPALGMAWADAPEPMTPAAFAAAVGALMRAGCADADPAARLIVRSAQRIAPRGAKTVLYGGHNLWVLQFDSPAAAAQARSFYAQQAQVTLVQADAPVSPEDPNGSPAARVTASPSHLTKYTHLSWGPSFLGVNTMLDHLTHGGNPAPQRVVAVLDSGVQHNHPSLIGRLLPSTVNTSASGEPGSAEDDNGHGTGVAGIVIDASSENVKVRAYKVLDCHTAGTLLTLIAGLQCAIADGVDVINMSLGFSETSDALQAVLDEAHEKGIVLIGAAGNKRTDAPFYPSSCDHVLRISAVNENGEFAGFSNYGSIDLAAPGVNIKTAALGGGYQTVRGTSEAAPFVAAVAAMLLTAHPCLGPDALAAVLKGTAIPPKHASLDPARYGAGVLQAPNPATPAVRALLLPYCGAADLTAYHAAVARAAAIEDLSPYEAVTVERLTQALAVQAEDYTACEQPDLNLLTAEINAAVDGLALWSPRSFSLLAPKTKISRFGGIQLTAQLRPVYARTQSVTWYSGNPNVVSVSNTGYVRYVSDGAATVYCRIVFDDGTTITRGVEITCEMRPFDQIFSLLLSMLRFILFPMKNNE